MTQSPLEAYQSLIAAGTLTPDPDQAAAIGTLQKLYEALIRPTPKKFFGLWAQDRPAPDGLYIYGDVGRGKTMLMDLFFDALPTDLRKRRVHFHGFMQEVHDYLHKARQSARTGNDTQVALLKFADHTAESARILCFDEFHVTDIADAMILGRLFSALLDKGVCVVATSNWPPDDLYQDGLQRDRFLPFIALLKEKLSIVWMTGGTDYRLQCLAGTGVYFHPLGKVAANNAESVFKRLTQNAETYPETLTIKGRTLHVHEATKGVARFSFAQLCERPLGAADYLAIAHNYHTVFLEGLPKLGYDRRNEAKRLMILIDTLYDAHTKLVVTADAPPDKLYRGHDHEFEFQRTVSRLIEMQSADYLGK